MEKFVAPPAPGYGELSKDNILQFLYSFKKRTGMYVANPSDLGIVSSFLNGYLYCCYLQGFKIADKLDAALDTEQFINTVISAVEGYEPANGV